VFNYNLRPTFDILVVGPLGELEHYVSGNRKKTTVKCEAFD